MSNPISGAMGASFKGQISVKDAGLVGMISLRGDLNSADLAKAVKSATGTALPETGKILFSKKGSTAWMSPDELLLLVDYETVTKTVERIEKQLAGAHFLAVNVSDARAIFELSGKGIRDVLAKGSPANLSPSAFGVGDLRRSRIGQLAVAIWMSSETSASIICFRSVSEHIFNSLKTAAQKGADPKFYN